MLNQVESSRLLIWGKTYPELSKKYFETVCTAGVLENGRPVRLYPISFRYLNEKFKNYQWITARIWKNDSDSRPESYRIDCDSIQLGETVNPTSDEWGCRAEYMFRNPSWQFESVEALLDDQKTNKTSIAVVTPRKIESVELVARPDEERRSFQEKFNDLKTRLQAKQQQMTLFEQERALPVEMKSIEFLSSRIHIHWTCSGASCKTHSMQILDWGVCELQRREGHDAALSKVREICDLEKYALRFFLGNAFMYPGSFMIVGLWHPKRANLLFS